MLPSVEPGGVPVPFNAAMFTVLILYIKARIGTIEAKFDGKLESMDAKIESLLAEMNARFEEQTQALLRVEGVLDARLKHVEERER